MLRSHDSKESVIDELRNLEREAENEKTLETIRRCYRLLGRPDLAEKAGVPESLGTMARIFRGINQLFTVIAVIIALGFLGLLAFFVIQAFFEKLAG
ncbi:MAG: hypothetical protein IJS28_03380 [Synergistaceae bacterium]|nr:hypothetical protein [Synergistaceae bacterium]MBQ7220002.1 hypothetical protein [Synergistaceae bacterium]